MAVGARPAADCDAGLRPLGRTRPLFPYAWTDRLGETFANLDLAPVPDVGHFPHREDPHRAAAEIAAFFSRIGWAD